MRACDRRMESAWAELEGLLYHVLLPFHTDVLARVS